jgi:hypothetical protein
MARRWVTPALYVLFLVFITAALWTSFALQSLRSVPAKAHGPDERTHVEDDAVVQGDYLLGVGKADVTG